RYDSIIEINSSAKTITVESGALMRDVIEEAAKAGLALTTLTSWDGVSAGGSISTGAHGSGFLGKGSVIDSYVVGMRLVVPASASEGYAKVVQLTEADHDLKAARLSLGTLGVISQITFSLEPMFKRSISINLEDDDGLENQLESFWNLHEFGKIYWYVANRKVLMERVDRITVDVPGDGINKAAYQPTTVLVAEQNALNYERIERERDADALCNMTATSMNNRAANGDGYLNDRISFTGNPVVGLNHLMQSTGGCQVYNRKQENDSACMPDEIVGKNKSICEWDRRVRGTLVYDVELRVPLSRARDAVLDIKRLRDLNPQTMCGLDRSGILIRGVTKSNAYLGPVDDLVTFEISYHRSRQAFTPVWNMDVYQEIEQMLIEKHGGSLHWGKSGGHLFEGLARKTVNLQRFLGVKKRFDPQGLFSNDWIERLL
ncbi:hypothetical protein KI387_008599, partial [Taxus chinensis]